MNDYALAAIISGCFALSGTMITAVIAQARGSKTRLGKVLGEIADLREENSMQHGVTEVKLDNLGDASERIETRLDGHIEWHMENKK